MTTSDKAWVFVLCIVLAGSVVGLLSVNNTAPEETTFEPGASAVPENPSPIAPSVIEPPRFESAGTPTPATATAPARNPAEILPYTPLRDARVGEYARYAALDDIQILYRVVGLDSLGATIEIEVFQAGRPLGLPARRMENRDLDPLRREAERAEAERRMTPVVIEAAGRAWNVLLNEDRWIDEDIPYVRRTWVSPDAPVLGILGMELEGAGRLEARLELIDWGVDAGHAEP